ncbi:hypothetical protein [Herbaspirillum seropedicae]|uniref:hypothetical protein n=1 Tax=Herbaspirillum seropedicae TaxID=964 RepID=UPI000847EFA1|nr:hypothetical protein [Herbaspirillum seropedicae]AON56554.1 hypothetical protein Hsc_4297 [Herbaspirillum seropedicae]
MQQDKESALPTRPLALVHIDTLRREYTSAWLLAKELSRRGYRVLLTSRLSTGLLLKLLAPDVLVLTHTFTLPNAVKRMARARGTRIYVNIVEEVIEDETYMSIMYRPDVEVENFDGIFTWSEWARDWVIKNTKLDAQRVHCVGSIRNSVLKRLPERKKTGVVGLLSRFESLNTWDRRHPFIDLMGIDAEDTSNIDTRYYFEKKLIDAEAFSLTCKLIRQLIAAGQKVAIRPHPNEFKDSYHLLEKEFGSNLLIDDSRDICEFLAGVDVVVGPVSSAYTEAYIAGIPIVSLHNMQRYRYQDPEIYDSLDRLSAGSYLPKTVAEAVQLCLQDGLSPKRSPDLDKYLDAFYSLNGHPDPVSDMADIIARGQSRLSASSRFFNRMAAPLRLGIDVLRLIQSLSFGRKKVPFPVLRQYHYNGLLHEPSSFMEHLTNRS